MSPEQIAQLFCQDCTILAYTTDITNAWTWTLESCTLDRLEAPTLADLEPLAVAAARAISDATPEEARPQ